MYKLIALDLDGTLTDKNKNILEETKQELIKLAQKGIIIVLASGRPTAGIFKEAKELTLDKVVCPNIIPITKTITKNI